MKRMGVACASVLAGSIAWGCGSGNDSPTTQATGGTNGTSSWVPLGGYGGEGGSGGSQGGAGIGGSGVGAVDVLRVVVYDLIDEAPIAGVRVCIHNETYGCVVSNELGLAPIAVPENQPVVLEYDSPDLRFHLLPIRGEKVTEFGASGEPVLTLGVTQNEAATMLADAHQVNDPNGAHTFGAVVQGAGATATLTGQPPEKGPYYLDGKYYEPVLDPPTRSNGAFGFFNIYTGSAELLVEMPGLSCVPMAAPMVGGSEPNANAAVLPLEAGAITVASGFDCK